MTTLSKALIVDTETSGLDHTKDHLVEVGLVLWSIEHRTTIAQASWVVAAPENPCAEINRIPPALLPEGERVTDVLSRVRGWSQRADVLIAHGDFDPPWFGDLQRPWIDSCWDLDWPLAASADSRKCTALALAHGLAVLEAHRALADCQLLARLLERVAELGHDVETMLRRAMRPKTKVYSLAPFEMKEIVKTAGFRWNPEEKVWWRMMPLEDVPALSFDCTTAAPRPAARRYGR